MAEHYLVKQVAGPAWDTARGRRRQAGWDEHAAFMDRIVEEGFVYLAGPVGEGEGDYALLVVNAGSEAEVRERLGADPWYGSVLEVASVERWRVWLRSEPKGNRNRYFGSGIGRDARGGGR